MADRKARKHAMTSEAQRLGLKKCLEWGEVGAIRSIERSIECGYLGLFKVDAEALSNQRTVQPAKPRIQMYDQSVG